MSPNAAIREARQQARRIRVMSETASVRAAVPENAAATMAAGAVAADGEFRRFGRLDVDPLVRFYLAE